MWPSSKTFYWPFQGGTSFVDLLCFCSVLCLLCLCARLFICALWSPAGKGLTSWLSFVLSNCEFVTFPLGQVWYLIVSTPDLCTLTYFHSIDSWYCFLPYFVCQNNLATLLIFSRWGRERSEVASYVIRQIKGELSSIYRMIDFLNKVAGIVSGSVRRSVFCCRINYIYVTN